LRDRRIPADFCARLVAGLDINPSWLLTGEGVPYASDLTASAHDSIGSLLELVIGLNAVQRLRLGALTGKGHRQALLRLGRELETFQRLSDQLTAQVKPLFERTLEEVHSAFGRSRPEQADPLLNALERVLPMCRDETLEARVAEARAFLESERGRLDHALKIRRQIVQRSLLSPAQHIETRITDDNNYLATLFHTFYLAEAHRMARVLAALHEQHRHLPLYWVLPGAVHMLEAEVGRLRESLAGLLQTLPRMPELNRSVNHANLTYAHLLAGTLTLPEAIAAEHARAQRIGPMPREASARMLVRVALLVESKPDLDRLLKFSRVDLDRSDEKAQSGLGRHARYVSRALADPSPRLYGQYLADDVVQAAMASPAARVRFVAHVYATQLARLTGAGAAAERLEQAETERLALELGQLPWVSVRALHFRNAALLVGSGRRRHRWAELKAQAQAFIDQHHDNGYLLFDQLGKV
jgi:hypothetical protein